MDNAYVKTMREFAEKRHAGSSWQNLILGLIESICSDDSMPADVKEKAIGLSLQTAGLIGFDREAILTPDLPQEPSYMDYMMAMGAIAGCCSSKVHILACAHIGILKDTLWPYSA